MLHKWAGSDLGWILREFDLIKLAYLSYSERQVWANIVDRDQMPQYAASDQGLHCLPLIQQFYTHSFMINEMDFDNKYKVKVRDVNI